MAETSTTLRGPTAGKVGRPRQAVAVRLDRSLLELATTAFRESDFSDTSLASLAAKIGVSKPTIYRRFESRNALIEAMVETQLAALITADDEAPELPPLDRLRGYAWRLFGTFLMPGTARFIRFVVRESAEVPRLAELRHVWHEQVVQQLVSLIMETQANGGLRAGDPRALANLMVDLLYTPITLGLLDYDPDAILSGQSPEAFFAWRMDIFFAAAR